MPALNLLKSDEAYRLAKELAQLRGKSMTAVVIEAARKELERMQRDEERMQYWLRVGDEIRASADPEWLARDPTDELYDEDGLPA